MWNTVLITPALSHVSCVHRSPALFWFKFRFFFSTVSFSNEDNHCQLYATLDFVKFIVSICEQTNDLSFTDKSAFWTSYFFFFSKSCLKVGGVAYTRVRLIHESLRYFHLPKGATSSTKYFKNVQAAITADVYSAVAGVVSLHSLCNFVTVV